MSQTSDKKLLENPVVSSMVVPVAIVLIGALIIFGVTQLLSTDRGYKDLVREMHSKTFGNRWTAAYELSKYISSQQIPEEDIPWLIQNLSEVYSGSNDQRTKEFIIVALGALRNELTLPVLNTALKTEGPTTKLRVVVALSNMPKGVTFDWSQLDSFLSGDDATLKKATMLTFATHKVSGKENLIAELLKDSNQTMRFTAGLALSNYSDRRAIDVLKELLFTNESKEISPQQLEALKLNLLTTIEKNNWKVLSSEIEKVSNDDMSLKVKSKARELLNILKK
ncbi:MAG: HEAT repeat domain-containing protein [Oligoflexia bacterium]|nr:HEAT repeat domain-containing protein [Oligoflexia bacterium]